METPLTTTPTKTLHKCQVDTHIDSPLCHYYPIQSISNIAFRFNGAANNMKVRQLTKLLEDDGWYVVATRGSHRQYKHPKKQGRVTIAGKRSDDLARGTLNSILKQAGLKEK